MVYREILSEYKKLVGLGLRPVAVKTNHELQSELLDLFPNRENRLKKFYGMDVLTDEFLPVPRILVDAENVPEFTWM